MEITPKGILTEQGYIPLWSGEFQFWRADPETWKPALKQMKKLGLPIVSTYLSWRRHEADMNVFDFDGHTDPRLNVTRFLDLCKEVGLYVHMKPGPWICAEEPAGGYPDWLIAISELHVLNSRNETILGYNPPFQTPIPSLLHLDYLIYAERWCTKVDELLKPYTHPDGPILLLQLDNEPSQTFHDRFFESDYNPAALNTYSKWLKEKYTTKENEAAPREIRINGWDDLNACFTWAEFKEWTLSNHIAFLRSVHQKNGLTNVVYTVNLNEHPQLSTPNSWFDLQQSSGLAGYDYYFIPPFKKRDLLNVALSVNYSLEVAPLAWAPEMMSGIWISPGVDEDHPGYDRRDVEFQLLLGLAYGLKGMNFYMAVNRENWKDAPIQQDGTPDVAYTIVENVVNLSKKIPDFYSLQPVRQVAILFDPRSAREAYIAAGNSLMVDQYELGSTYKCFLQAFEKIVDMNLNPAIIDPRVEGHDFTQYKLLFVPYGPHMDQMSERMIDQAKQAGCKVILLERSSSSPAQSRFLHSPKFQFHEIVTINELDQILAREYIEPMVGTDNPNILTILQKFEQTHVLFIINKGETTENPRLIFCGCQAGSLESLSFPLQSTPIQNGQAEMEIPSHSVLVYLYHQN